MRIACYHNQAPGGARRAIHELCQQLTRRHTVDVFSLDTADESFVKSSDFASNITVFDFRPRRPLRSAVGLNMLRWRQDLKRLEDICRLIAAQVDAGDYDAVLTDPCRFVQAAPSVLAYLATPSAYYCHEPPRRFVQAVARPESAPLAPQERARAWLRGRLYDAVIKPIDRRNVNKASAVLANSQMTRQMIMDYYGRDATISALGVDAQRFRPGDRPGRDSYVLSVGALAVPKGFDFIIRSLGLCPPSLRPTLVIVANADDCGVGRDLRRLAARSDVQLELLLEVSDDELIRLYQRARAFVFASHHEPFGLAVLEAMACATPVITVEEGGPRETVIDGVTGLLVPRREEDFAEAVMRVLENPVLASSLAAEARKHVEAHWTWQAAGERIERHLLALDSPLPVGAP
ncbi:MAG: glycosyltransferase family 4 protein [Dehalococcoidia bacterium]|nr:glycosyltransferase family 4 protein [Dehalococcoidia bacterium]